MYVSDNGCLGSRFGLSRGSMICLARFNCESLQDLLDDTAKVRGQDP